MTFYFACTLHSIWPNEIETPVCLQKQALFHHSLGFECHSHKNLMKQAADLDMVTD